MTIALNPNAIPGMTEADETREAIARLTAEDRKHLTQHDKRDLQLILMEYLAMHSALRSLYAVIDCARQTERWRHDTKEEQA